MLGVSESKARKYQVKRLSVLDAEVYVSKPYFDLTCSSEIEKRDDDDEEEDNEKFVEEKSWTNDVHEEHVGS